MLILSLLDFFYFTIYSLYIRFCLLFYPFLFIRFLVFFVFHLSPCLSCVIYFRNYQWIKYLHPCLFIKFFTSKEWIFNMLNNLPPAATFYIISSTILPSVSLSIPNTWIFVIVITFLVSVIQWVVVHLFHNHPNTIISAFFGCFCVFFISDDFSINFHIFSYHVLLFT